MIEKVKLLKNNNWWPTETSSLMGTSQNQCVCSCLCSRQTSLFLLWNSCSCSLFLLLTGLGTNWAHKLDSEEHNQLCFVGAHLSRLTTAMHFIYNQYRLENNKKLVHWSWQSNLSSQKQTALHHLPLKGWNQVVSAGQPTGGQLGHLPWAPNLQGAPSYKQHYMRLTILTSTFCRLHKK